MQQLHIFETQNESRSQQTSHLLFVCYWPFQIGDGRAPVSLAAQGWRLYEQLDQMSHATAYHADFDDSCVPPPSFPSLHPAAPFVSLPPPTRQGVLEDVSSRGDTESRSGLAEVVSEVSLALARRSIDWVASASELEHFNNRNVERAEATFSQYSIQLRTKVRCSRLLPEHVSMRRSAVHT